MKTPCLISALKTALWSTTAINKVLVGWAVPGLDEDAELPTHFTMTATADHADLSWMMTFLQPPNHSSGSVMKQMKKSGSLSNTVDELKIGLTALCDGEALPEGEGKPS